MVLASVWFAIF